MKYENGVETTIEHVEHDKWDFRVTASHPQLSTQAQDFVSGAFWAAEATERRLVAEISTLLP